MNKFIQIGGFGTSDVSRGSLHSVHLQFNSFIDQATAIIADQTRSKGEKSPILASVKSKVMALVPKLEAEKAAIESRQNKALELLQGEIDRVSLADAIVISKHLGELNTENRINALAESKDAALAVMRAPTAFSGPMRDAAWRQVIDSHYPAAGEELRAVETDLEQVADSINFIEKQAFALEIQIDREALATRV